MMEMETERGNYRGTLSLACTHFLYDCSPTLNYQGGYTLLVMARKSCFSFWQFLAFCWILRGNMFPFSQLNIFSV